MIFFSSFSLLLSSSPSLPPSLHLNLSFYSPRVSLMLLYILMASVSFMNSLTTSPCSFSTTSTSSGLAILLIITSLTYNPNICTFNRSHLYVCSRHYYRCALVQLFRPLIPCCLKTIVKNNCFALRMTRASSRNVGKLYTKQ